MSKGSTASKRAETVPSEQRKAANLMAESVVDSIRPTLDFNTSLDPESAGPKHDIVHPSRENDGELAEKAELARKESDGSLFHGHKGLINHGGNHGFFSNASGHVQPDGSRRPHQATEDKSFVPSAPKPKTGLSKNVKPDSDRKRAGD